MEKMAEEQQLIYLGVLERPSLLDPELAKRFGWLVEHLNSAQGADKKRPTCPWTAPAIADKRFHIGDARHFSVDFESICQLIEDMVSVYQGYGTFTPPDKHPATLTILAPDDLRPQTILRILEHYRPQLTPIGLMLGALDPVNELTSLSGGDGYPYQAPWNFFTTRWMVPGDYVFLNLNPAYREVYVKFFGHWPLDN